MSEVRYRFSAEPNEGYVPLTERDDNNPRKAHGYRTPWWFYWCCCTQACLFVFLIGAFIANGGPTGACCRRDGCSLVSENVCLRTEDAVFFGVNTTCDTHSCNVSCCCLQECLAIEGECPDECVQTTTYDECKTPGVACGINEPGRVLYDVDCATNPCNVSCCCTPTAPIPFTMFEDQCLSDGGIWFLDSPTCEPNPCAGACCIVGSCLLAQTQGSCTLSGGLWQGRNTTCESLECPAEPRGSCCLTGSGSMTCLENATEAICDALPQSGQFITSSVFMENVTCDSPDACGGQTNENKCCSDIDNAPGTCTNDLTPIECQFLGGAYTLTLECLPSGSCGVPEGTGACCANATCMYAEELTCEASSGTFFGPATVCGEQCSGACCSGSNCVVTLDEQACEANLGTFVDIGVACENNTCIA